MFLIGANLPWIRYGIDFGANAWRPGGGVAQPEERARLENTFERLAATGRRWQAAASCRCPSWRRHCPRRLIAAT